MTETSGTVSGARIDVEVADDLSAAAATCLTSLGAYRRTHGPELPLTTAAKELMLARLDISVVSVRWRQLSLIWPITSQVFPPTWDSLYLLAALLRERVRADSVWDVGTGSGILGLGALALGLTGRVLMTDIDPRAAQLAASNARSEIRAGRASVFTQPFPPPVPPQSRFSLIVANPPYFDEPEPLLDPWTGQATDSTGLRSALVERWPDYARGVVYLSSESSTAGRPRSIPKVIAMHPLALPAAVGSAPSHVVRVSVEGELPTLGDKSTPVGSS